MKKKILILIIIVCTVVVSFFILASPYICAFIASLFNNYPVNGSYYFGIYSSNGKINYYSYYYYAPSALAKTAKFDNLELYPDLMNEVHNIPVHEDQITDTSVVINFLLENGYARIVDESKSTDQEIKSQQKAQDNKCGVWSGNEEPVGSGYIPEKGILKKIYEFTINTYNNNWWIRWIIAPVISFSFVVSVIFKVYKFIVKSRKIKILFAGDKSAGKTTLKIAYMEPYRSEAYLLDNNPTRTIINKKISRDDNDKKITVYADSIDYPGDDYYVVLNTLNKKNGFNAFKKTYVILVLSPTRTNNKEELDEEYILDQFNTVSKLWAAVIKSNSTTKITKFVTFVNKCDLFSNKEDLEKVFSRHIKVLNDTCAEKGIAYETIIGSSVKRDGIYRLEKIFLKR